MQGTRPDCAGCSRHRTVRSPQLTSPTPAPRAQSEPGSRESELERRLRGLPQGLDVEEVAPQVLQTFTRRSASASSRRSPLTTIRKSAIPSPLAAWRRFASREPGHGASVGVATHTWVSGSRLRSSDDSRR